MASFEDRDNAVKALYRMIVYARDEAARLLIADAALLLGYAEDAVATRHPARFEDCVRAEAPTLPIVHH